MSRMIERLSIGRIHLLAVAACLASTVLLSTPSIASAAEGDRSCACNNETVCEPYAYMRFCCEWGGGGPPTCGCTLYITNCNDQ